MKFVTTAVLAATLLFTGCATKKIGYNIGACAPDGFIAAHIEYADESKLTFTDVSPAPNKVFKLKKPTVYVYTKTDEEGKHYVSNNMEIVVEADNEKIVGKLESDGHVVSLLFGVPGTVAQVVEHANAEYAMCMDLQGSHGPAPNTAQN